MTLTFKQLLNADFKSPTIALFWNTDCAPCERLKPTLREVCKQLGVRLEEFHAVNEMAAIRELGLRAVPGVYVVHRGKATQAFTGNLLAPAIKLKLAALGVEQR